MKKKKKSKKNQSFDLEQFQGQNKGEKRFIKKKRKKEKRKKR